MKAALLLLLLLAQVLPGTSQQVRVRTPYPVDGSYQYSFLQDDKYILGVPQGAGLLANSGKYCLWDAKTGKFIHGFDNGDLGNYPSTFSPDGRWYAVHPSSDRLFFGDVQKDAFWDSLPFHPVISLPQDLRISPDGKFAVYDSAYGAGTIAIYDVARKQRHFIREYCDNRLTRFSKDSRYVCLFTYGRLARIFSLPEIQPVRDIPLPEEINQQNINLGFGFIPQDSLLEVADDSTTYLVHMETRKVEQLLHVEASLWIRNGILVFISKEGEKRQLIAYNVTAAKKTVLAELAGHRVVLSGAGDLAILRDETNFSNISYAVYDKLTGKCRWTLGPKYNDEFVVGLTFSPSGKYYIIETNAFFRVFATDGQKPLTVIVRHGQGFLQTGVFFSGNERKLGIKDGTTVTIYHLPGGLPVAALQNGGNYQNYTIMGFAADSRSIRINTYTKGVVNFNLDSAYINPSRPHFTGDLYSPDHHYYLRSNTYGDLSLYDAIKQEEIHHLQLDISGFNSLFSPKGDFFLIYEGMPNKAYLFETKTGKQVWEKDWNIDFISGNPLSFDRNGQLLITASLDTYDVYEVANGNHLANIPRKGWITEPVVDATSTFLYLADSSGALRTYNLKAKMKLENRPLTDPAIKDLHYTLFADSMRCIRVGDYGSGRFTDRFNRVTLPTHYDRGNFFVRESQDHRFLLAYFAGDSIEVWDLAKKQVSSIIPVNHIQVENFYISPNNQWVAVEGRQKELYLFDRPRNLYMGAFYFSNGPAKQSAYIDNQGYYKADRDMANDLRFSIDGVTYDFDQLDLRLNRPDKVLANLGCKDTGLIRSYHMAYLDRLRNMGMDSTQFSTDIQAPVADVVNEKQLEDNAPNAAGVSLNVHVYVSKPAHFLKRLFITANGNPLFGSAGWDMAALRTRDTTLSIRVGLVPGSNQIKVSCLDDQGAESYRTPINIEYLPATADTPQTWFIGIGVSHYKKAADSLKYPVKSILGVDSVLSRIDPARYTHVLLLDSAAVKENILAIRQKLLQAAKPRDKVILAFSGHGCVASSGGRRQFFYGTSDIDFTEPATRGISYDTIAWLLDGVPAQKKLILIDACFAGSLDVSGTNGADFELMQELFSNTSRGNGATVIAASAGDNRAYEPAGLGNSYFMYYLLKALREGIANSEGDRSIRVQDLLQYLVEQVSAQTLNKQKPDSRLVNYDNNWIISPGL